MAKAAADAEASKVNEKIVADIQAAGVKLVTPAPAFRKAALPIVEKAARDILAPGVWEAAVEAAGGAAN